MCWSHRFNATTLDDKPLTKFRRSGGTDKYGVLLRVAKPNIADHQPMLHLLHFPPRVALLGQVEDSPQAPPPRL